MISKAFREAPGYDFAHIRSWSSQEALRAVKVARSLRGSRVDITGAKMVVIIGFDVFQFVLDKP